MSNAPVSIIYPYNRKRCSVGREFYIGDFVRSLSILRLHVARSYLHCGILLLLLLILYRIHVQMMKKNKYNYRQGRYGDSEGLVRANKQPE